MTELEIVAWYDVLRALPCVAPWDVQATISIVDEDHPRAGSYHPWLDHIVVRQDVNPYEMVATLVHEVGHAIQNPRHRRAHGYSWRRATCQIAYELTGVNLQRLSEERRHFYRTLHDQVVPRRVSIDCGLVYVLTTLRARAAWSSTGQSIATVGPMGRWGPGNSFPLLRRDSPLGDRV